MPLVAPIGSQVHFQHNQKLSQSLRFLLKSSDALL